MDILLILLVAVLWWNLWALKKRVLRLEAMIAGAPMAGAAPASVVVPETAADANVGPDAATAGPWQAAGAAAAVSLPLLAQSSATAPPRRDAAFTPVAAWLAALGRWLTTNWVYAIAALSLVFAGVFLVQYGMDRGLLPPVARVIATLLLGAALIGGGEAVRRRWGDGADRSTAYLPSVFSGAGVVALFIGVFAARQLYGLIGPEAAFAGLTLAAGVGLVLGWFHGPLLAAVGLIGAAATPFLAGGGAEVPLWLPFHYALIAGLGLGIDTLRRWAWISVLALVLAYGGLLLLRAGDADHGALALAATLIAVLAIAIPARSLWPDQAGPTLTAVLLRRGAGPAPSFPVRLAAGAMLATTAALVLLPDAGMIAFVCLAGLTVALALWGVGAAGLADLALLPVAGFVGRLLLEAAEGFPLWAGFRAAEVGLRAPESGPPLTVTLLVALALAGSLAAALRSLRGSDHPAGWAALAAGFAPVAMVAAELFWQPALVLSPGLWAAHVIVVAAVMVGLAGRFAQADGAAARRTAYAVLAALTLIALALFVVLTQAALTVALAVLIVVAAALDRRLQLPEMGWFIQAGVAVIGWRLVIDPGLDWAMDDAPLWEVALSFGAAIAAALVALRLIAGLGRAAAGVALESMLAAAAALLANVALARWLSAGGSDLPMHAAAGLAGMPWLITMFAQLYRRQASTRLLRGVRWGLAAISGAIGLGALMVGLVFGNPVSPMFAYGSEAWVRGPVLINTLLVAYGLPGLLLIAGARRVPLPRWLRLGLTAAGAALGILWAGLAIRHLWHGPDLASGGVLQSELYSYTIAMLLAGAALLYLAIARRSDGLRRLAMAVIAVTVAKVFLIDASGLSGLTRVASFLGLGLSLAGLAWLNRWAAAQGGDPGDEAA